MNELQLLNNALRLTAPVLLIALGGLFALKVNVFNLALDAFALIGCFSAVAGAYYTNSVAGGVLIAVIVTVIMMLIYGIFVFELDVNAVVCAVAFITLSSGLTRYLMKPIFNSNGKYILPSTLGLKAIHFDWLDNIPVLGTIFNNQSILVYVSLIAPFIIYIFLYKTNLGLSLRSVGLNPDAANAAGINAKQISYFALILNGVFCGLAGAQLALALNMFNVGMTNGRGLTALAVLILTNSAPILVLLASLLFGIADAITNVLSAEGYPSQILQMLPYALALLAAVLPLSYKKLTKKIRRKKNERMIMVTKQ